LITYLVAKKNIDCLLVYRYEAPALCARHGLDGYSFGYPFSLVEECVFDRLA